MHKMIYLLPFLNCFLLYICIEEKQLFYKPYSWFMNNISVYFPVFINKILGVCILCTATWLGIIELTLFHAKHVVGLWELLLLIPYNAIVTNVLFKLTKTK